MKMTKHKLKEHEYMTNTMALYKTYKVLVNGSYSFVYCV